MTQFIVLDLNMLKDDVAQATDSQAPLLDVYKNAHEEIVIGNKVVDAENAETLRQDPARYVFNGPKATSGPIFSLTQEQLRKAAALNNDILTSRARFLHATYLKKNPASKTPLTPVITTVAEKIAKQKATLKPVASSDSESAPVPVSVAAPTRSRGRPVKNHDILPAQGAHLFFNVTSYATRKSEGRRNNKNDAVLLSGYLTADNAVTYGNHLSSDGQLGDHVKHAEPKGIVTKKLFDITVDDIVSYDISKLTRIPLLVQYFHDTPEDKRSPREFCKKHGGGYDFPDNDNLPPWPKVVRKAAPKETPKRDDGVIVHLKAPSWDAEGLTQQLIGKYHTVYWVAYTLAEEAGKIDPVTPGNNGTGQGTLNTCVTKKITGENLQNLHMNFCKNNFVLTTSCLLAVSEGLVDVDDLLQGAQDKKTRTTPSGKTADDLFKNVREKHSNFAPHYTMK